MHTLATKLDNLIVSLYDAPAGYRQAHARWSELHVIASQMAYSPNPRNVATSFGRRGYLTLARYALECGDIGLFLRICESAMEWESLWFRNLDQEE